MEHPIKRLLLLLDKIFLVCVILVGAVSSGITNKLFNICIEHRVAENKYLFMHHNVYLATYLCVSDVL